MSASVKTRLAGRQPSNRGGVPRVMTRFPDVDLLTQFHRNSGDKRGSDRDGPQTGPSPTEVTQYVSHL